MLQLKEGGTNTTFFHHQACHRQRKNVILSLQHSGQVLMNHDEIAAVVDGYYVRLLGSALEQDHAL